MRRVILIAGAGSFALRTRFTLEALSLDVNGFVDKGPESTLDGLPVFTLECVRSWSDPLKDAASVIVSISGALYRADAIARLVSVGLSRSQILELDHSDQLLMIESMHKAGYRVDDALRNLQLGSFCDFQERVLGELGARAVSLCKGRADISFHFYGLGGGFRGHLNDLATKLAKNYRVVTVAESLDAKDENSHNLTLQWRGCFAKNKFSLLAISARYWPCSHSSVPKITCTHTIYDYEPFDRVDHISQPDRHFIFSSSVPAFEYTKKLLIEGNYKNDVILIPGGYPRLDSNRSSFKMYTGVVDTIVYAPTAVMWDIEDCRLTYSIFSGTRILRELDENFPDYRIVFRPHPSDLEALALGRSATASGELIGALDYCANSRVILESGSATFSSTYSRSEVLISDTSSTAYTFGLTTHRPVIFFAPGGELISEKYGHYQSIRDRIQFGLIVASVDELSFAVRDAIRRRGEFRECIMQHEKKILFNPGSSAHYFEKCVDAVLNEKSIDGWWSLREHARNG